MPFFDRQAELSFLQRQARADRAALVVLYGRRRTGKTSLLRTLAADRRSILYVADTSTRADQLAAFRRVAEQALGRDALAGVRFGSWDDALRFVAARARTEPLLCVLDEFPYLCAGDASLPSVIQRLWDAELKDSRVHLVLCGSYVAFMEREVLGAKNPLYGRRTGEYLLGPLPFEHARAFFPGWSDDAQVSAFGVLGGIPAYLERFDVELDLRANILETILEKGGPLYSEPRFLLMDEVREPHTYFSICRAVAFGRTTPNEIAQAAGIEDRGKVSRYLTTLRELRLIERRVPSTERNPERTRRGRYRLADPFFRFWFRFVLPNRSALEAGDPARVYERKVRPHLDQHVALTFEEVCLEHAWSLLGRDALPGHYDRIGGWWRAREEVDLVGVDDAEKALLLGECKWSKRAVGEDVLDALVAKADAVAKDAGWTPRRVDYALWSRSGFTEGLRARAEAEGVALYGLDALPG